MTDAIGYASVILNLNIGTEMIYVLQQRLAAMRVTEHKRSKVYDDIIDALLNPKQADAMFTPQTIPREELVMLTFEKIVGSTIFRMNSGSRDKLFRLMLMGVKYQVISCQDPPALFGMTVQRLEALNSLASSAQVAGLVTAVIDRTKSVCSQFTRGEWSRVRQVLLAYLEGKRYKVSLFMQRGLQNGDGSYVLSRSSEVQFPEGVEQPGLVRYFSPDGTCTHTDSFERPVPQFSDLRLHSHWTSRDLGRNLYLALTSQAPATSPAERKESITIYTWGRGDNGLLGHSNRLDALQPAVVVPMLGKHVTQIVLSAFCAVALAGESVYVWGMKENNNPSKHPGRPLRPTEYLANVGVVQLVASRSHILLRTKTGGVWSWGFAGSGELGHGEGLSSVRIAKRVEGLSHATIVSVFAGKHYSFALGDDGTVYGFGRCTEGQLGLEPGIYYTPVAIPALTQLGLVSISCAETFCYGLTKEGELVYWGFDSRRSSEISEPHIVFTDLSYRGKPVRFASVSCGSHHTLAVSSQGHVYAWGLNSHGQLGLGESLNLSPPSAPTVTTDIATPTPRLSPPPPSGRADDDESPSPPPLDAVSPPPPAVAASPGWDGAQAGDATDPLVDLSTPTSPKPIATPVQATPKASTTTNTTDTAKDTATPTTTTAGDAYVSSPERICGLSSVVQVAAGSNHSVALTKGGRVFTWGDCARGQLGHADRQRLQEPQVVERLAGKKVRSVSVSKFLTCALVAHRPHKFTPADQSAAAVLGEASNQEELEVWQQGEIPPSFLCPITYDIMKKPCFAMDGHSYEREAILAWFSQRDTSPMTGQKLSSHDVIPNYNLQSQIADWRQQLLESKASSGAGGATQE